MVLTQGEIDAAERPIRVLVADDEPAIRNLVAATLAPQGYEVTTVRDGDEAKALLEREPFEVVITDYRMPGLNGIDVLRFAKLMNEDTQVVVITGHHGAEIQEKALSYGASDYLQKPFSLDAISQAVALAPRAPVERAGAELQASLAEKDEEIGELRAALQRSEMRLEDTLRLPAPKLSPEDQVFGYLCNHPEGADFDTLEAATGITGRNIVTTLAKLLDTGRARREFPLFFAVELPRAA